MKTEQKDYYAVLQLKRNCSADDIKRQYRYLAKKYHPDLHKADKTTNTERLRQLNEAYEALSAPNKRHEYDENINRQTSSFDNKPSQRNYSNDYHMCLSTLLKQRDDRNAIYFILAMVISFVIIYGVRQNGKNSEQPEIIAGTLDYKHINKFENIPNQEALISSINEYQAYIPSINNIITKGNQVLSSSTARLPSNSHTQNEHNDLFSDLAMLKAVTHKFQKDIDLINHSDNPDEIQQTTTDAANQMSNMKYYRKNAIDDLSQLSQYDPSISNPVIYVPIQ